MLILRTHTSLPSSLSGVNLLSWVYRIFPIANIRKSRLRIHDIYKNILWYQISLFEILFKAYSLYESVFFLWCTCLSPRLPTMQCRYVVWSNGASTRWVWFATKYGTPSLSFHDPQPSSLKLLEETGCKDDSFEFLFALAGWFSSVEPRKYIGEIRFDGEMYSDVIRNYMNFHMV